MAYGWRKAKWAGLALVVAFAPVDLLRAEEEDEEDEPSPISTVIFGSMEAGPAKTFASMGLKRALGGKLAGSGFRLFLKAGASQEQAPRRTSHGRTYKAESQAMLGYEWRIGSSFFALYAGSDVESEQRIANFGPSMITTRYGARLQADLWAVPADRTMLQANAYVSSVDHRLWARLAPGWQMPAGFYIGPEAEAYREPDYRKLRLGLHFTGLRFLGLVWRLAGGWEKTSDRPSAAYGTLGLHWLR